MITIKKSRSKICLASCALLVMSTGWGGVVSAQEPGSSNVQCGIRSLLLVNDDKEPPCLSESELAHSRAGFVSDNGFVIGFGFERLVSINGELSEQVNVALPELNLGDSLRIIPVARIGDTPMGIGYAGNETQLVDSIQQLSDVMVNVIQNESNDTIIEQLRIINVHVGGIGSASDWEAQRQLLPAIIEQFRP